MEIIKWKSPFNIYFNLNFGIFWNEILIEHLPYKEKKKQKTIYLLKVKTFLTSCIEGKKIDDTNDT